LTESDPTPAGLPESDDTDWANDAGESLDNGSHASLQLAYKAIAKFPELTRRYQKFVGTAAVLSTGVVVLASIAVTRRLHRGQAPERILEEITPDEIENAAKAAPVPEKPKRPGRRGSLFRH
jgi:hypothetical protein